MLDWNNKNNLMPPVWRGVYLHDAGLLIVIFK